MVPVYRTLERSGFNLLFRLSAQHFLGGLLGQVGMPSQVSCAKARITTAICQLENQRLHNSVGLFLWPQGDDSSSPSTTTLAWDVLTDRILRLGRANRVGLRRQGVGKQLFAVQCSAFWCVILSLCLQIETGFFLGLSRSTLARNDLKLPEIA